MSEYTWPVLEEIGEHFLEVLRRNPGISSQQLSDKLSISLSRVEEALEYASENDLVLSFDDHWFIAKSEAEREFAAHISQLWDQVTSIVRIKN
jgi:winged helix-turn-helix DNA-binding protein